MQRTKTAILSPRETSILEMLSHGRTYDDIRKALETTLGNVHAHCHNLRVKTGIMETRNQAECRRYLRFVKQEGPPAPPPAIEPRPLKPSHRQEQALRLVASGMGQEEIIRQMGINSPQTLLNLICQGAKRIGAGRAGWKRLQLIREWVAKEDGTWEEPAPLPAKVADPMSDPMF